MNIRANLLAALLFIKSRKSLEIDPEPPFEEAPPFKEQYLDLPDYVTQVKLTQDGYVTEPSGFLLPPDTVEVYQTLMGSKAWFSPAVKYLDETNWVLIISAVNPLQAFEHRIRLIELKFKILRRKI